jgi:prophage regulatory protein
MKEKIDKEGGNCDARIKKPKTSRIHQNSRIHRIGDIVEMYGISKPTVYRMIQAGTFPAPVALTGRRAVGWLRTSLQAWEAGLEESK